MKFKKILCAGAVLLGASGAFAQTCSSTTFSDLAASDCRGSLPGNINGSASELDYLSSQWGGTWTYEGKSDDGGSGPFTMNPSVSQNGTLTFDTPISGTFVIGLKAANQHSYYLFEAEGLVSSLMFDTTAGVATNKKGIAQDLSHANLYVMAPVPEPSTYALLIGGLGVLGFMARRRKA